MADKIAKITIDFSVLETGNPAKISIFDDSDWAYSENLPSYLIIQVPGSKREKTYSFKKYGINTLNSHNLGLSCLKGDCTEEEYVDLPDGIYTITLKSGYEDIDKTKYYLKTDRFDIEFSKVMITYGLDDYNKDFIDYMTNVKFLEYVAKSHTVLGDFVKAQRFFEESKKMLNQYLNCNGSANK